MYYTFIYIYIFFFTAGSFLFSLNLHFALSFCLLLMGTGPPNPQCFQQPQGSASLQDPGSGPERARERGL